MTSTVLASKHAEKALCPDCLPALMSADASTSHAACPSCGFDLGPQPTNSTTDFNWPDLTTVQGSPCEEHAWCYLGARSHDFREYECVVCCARLSQSEAKRPWLSKPAGRQRRLAGEPVRG